MSAVLLRRIFSSSVDFYDKLDQAFQQEMKNDLLKAINEEQAQAVRKKKKRKKTKDFTKQ